MLGSVHFTVLFSVEFAIWFSLHKSVKCVILIEMINLDSAALREVGSEALPT